MRQITKESINAFVWGFTFSKQNTKVRVFNDVIKLQLHDNTIAIRDRITNKIKISNCGWFTNTTKERLNGLPNVNIHQKNYIWYLNGKEWDGNLITIN
jgi:hypothetical protein